MVSSPISSSASGKRKKIKKNEERKGEREGWRGRNERHIWIKGEKYFTLAGNCLKGYLHSVNIFVMQYWKFLEGGQERGEIIASFGAWVKSCLGSPTTLVPCQKHAFPPPPQSSYLPLYPFIISSLDCCHFIHIHRAPQSLETLAQLSPW